MKRSDEEYCKTQFDSFLRESFGLSGVKWEPVPPKEEPPDYYLFLDNERYAIEVTALVEKISVGNSPSLPPAVISKILQEFVIRVKAVAKAEGTLHGNYVVYFTPIKNFATVSGKIQEGLLEYIRGTGNLDVAPEKVVFKTVTLGQRQLCEIQKVGGKPDRVSCGMGAGAKWQGEVIEGLCYLLNDRLDTKVNLLKDIAAPKILLLLDEYIFADQEEYKICINQIPSMSSFHTVFVLQDRRNRFLLYSQRSDWSTKQFITMPTQLKS